MERSEASRKVWYVLVNKDGSPYGETSTSGIHVDTSIDAYGFCDAVYNKNAFILPGIIPSQLVVYANKIVFEAKGEPLEEDAIINNYGNKKKDALIVVVPSISDHSTNKRRRINDDESIFIPCEIPWRTNPDVEVTMDDENTMLVAVGAPQSYSYSSSKFYVRSCYEKYYELITELLDRPYPEKINYISVTGTPGIGKSVFYFYFINRYLSENPGKSVITAAFTKDRVPKDCKLFRSNGEVHSCIDPTKKTFIPNKANGALPNGVDCDIYLYDGPPNAEPVGVKMVAFTSPNFGWLSSIEKESTHVTLYMPKWDLSELHYVNEALQLKIDKDEIKS